MNHLLAVDTTAGNCVCERCKTLRAQLYRPAPENTPPFRLVIVAERFGREARIALYRDGSIGWCPGDCLVDEDLGRSCRSKT